MTRFKTPGAPCLLAASREETWDGYVRALHLLVFLLIPLTASAQTFRITGTLLTSTGSAPIPHARISAEPDHRCSRSSARLLPAGTSAAGAFTLTLPCAGTWRLTASADGFATESYEQHGALSTGVVLTAAQPACDLKFRLAPKSSITGIVLDEAGEPVRNANVTLLDDSIDPTPSSFAQTDDRGAFEFPNLPAGTYLVAVHTQPWYAVAANAGVASTAALDPSLDLTYPITYFPGVADVQAASPIHLAGGDATEADIHLSPIPSIHLLIPVPNRPGADNGVVRRSYNAPPIQQISPLGQTQFQPTSMTISRNGTGETIDVGGLAPGTYSIAQGATFNARNRLETNQKILNIQKDSPRSVELATATESSASIPDLTEGTLKLSGFVTLQAKPLAGAMLLLVPVGASASSAAPAPQRQQTNTDGSFTFTNLHPGKYILAAIDQGWSLNWSDPTTLTTHLTRGTPINLTSSVTLPHPIPAQTTNQ
jgi:hypothetical protein